MERALAFLQSFVTKAKGLSWFQWTNARNNGKSPMKTFKLSRENILQGVTLELRLYKATPNISAWLQTSKVIQDIKKTHQVQRSIINLVSRCGRTDSCLNLHLDETFSSFYCIGTQHTGDPRDLNPLQWFYSHVHAHCMPCLCLVALNI